MAEVVLLDAGPLVAMAERMPEARIFTLDQDFRIYRRAGDRPLALIAPFAG